MTIYNETMIEYCIRKLIETDNKLHLYNNEKESVN